MSQAVLGPTDLPITYRSGTGPRALLTNIEGSLARVIHGDLRFAGRKWTEVLPEQGKLVLV